MRLLLVDDQQVVREGLKRIFGQQPDITSFGEASRASEAFRLVSEEEWDAAILSSSFAETTLLEVLKQLRQIQPLLPVLILSRHSEMEHVRQVFKAGAAGFTTYDGPPEELIKAIERLTHGQRYVSPTIAEGLAVEPRTATDRPPHDALSNREFQVMGLIASGKSLRMIADLLQLSDKTISTYRARALEKMGMKTNGEVIIYCIRNNLIDSEPTDRNRRDVPG
jgi:two-component system invasion response regulator UvrY